MSLYDFNSDVGMLHAVVQVVFCKASFSKLQSCILLYIILGAMKSRLQVLVLLLLATIANFGNGQQELRVAFITSFEGEFDSSVTVPAVKLAIEEVNRNSSILPGYKLVVELTENMTVARNFTNSKVK